MEVFNASELEESPHQVQDANFTFPERAQWEIILLKVNTVLMVLNTTFLMLGMGAAICLKEIFSHMKRPLGATIGMLGQFIVLPVTGFALCLMFSLSPYEALGVLIISCSPGGSFSNAFTYWCDGDLALSVTMTTCSSVMAFVGMPFNLWLYAGHWLTKGDDTIVVPFRSIAKSLAFVMGSVIVGMFIRHFHKKTASIITKIASNIGFVGVASGATFWLLVYRDIFVKASLFVYTAAILLPVTGFLLAYGLAKLLCQSHQVCRTIGIETGSQNMPVAASVILLSFHDPWIKDRILMFPTLYMVLLLVEAVIGISTFQLYKRLCTRKHEHLLLPMTKIEPGMQVEKASLMV
ncbi:ileal sodium/bile acid cotransporter-like isoform X1 [Macrobrachium rosenbergii]|uniref:ileal sodium/bile acid cotransporter-like isoform X1 n=1 Tax=Macrobrachium rosenbergii TaxID=79674 RepID=UPI0034D61D7B